MRVAGRIAAAAHNAPLVRRYDLTHAWAEAEKVDLERAPRSKRVAATDRLNDCLAQAVAAVLWPSFLAACLATMVFFAYVDPELLGHATSPVLEVSRMTGYGIGFFFFWLIALISSAISVYLLRTAHEPPERRQDPFDRRE